MVIGAASSPEKREVTRRLGADASAFAHRSPKILA
jgi:hypothetical protein